MKQLIEFLPIALFFIVYQLKGESVALGGWEYTFDGIFSATAVLMAATVLQVIISYALTRKLEKRLLWLLLAVLVFGGATLIFRNQMFIQWKPTIFNWVLALAFGLSGFFADKNLMERTLGSQIHLPKPVWSKLNLLWVSNFAIVGTLRAPAPIDPGTRVLLAKGPRPRGSTIIRPISRYLGDVRGRCRHYLL